MQNFSLKQSTAKARARTAIARSLETSVKAMLKDYQATTTGGEEFGTGEAAEQRVVDVSKQISNIKLSGTSLQETWESKDGTLFVLISLDLDTFQDSIKRMSNLSESIRKAVEARSEQAFKELDEATQ